MHYRQTPFQFQGLFVPVDIDVSARVTTLVDAWLSLQPASNCTSLPPPAASCSAPQRPSALIFRYFHHLPVFNSRTAAPIRHLNVNEQFIKDVWQVHSGGPCIHLLAYASAAADDSHKVVKVVASDGKSGEQKDLSYANCKVIGNGSFGVVFQAKVVGATKGDDDIAIKKVLQDKRFKVRSRRHVRRCKTDGGIRPEQNRELQIMRLVSHPNVVDLKAFFYSNGESKARCAVSVLDPRLHLHCSRRTKCT